MKILVVANSRIGDAVLTTGILNFFVHSFPGARFSIACGPLTAPLFSHMPGLAEIVVTKRDSRALRWFDVWRFAVRHRWDLVIDFKRSVLGHAVLARSRLVPGRNDPTRPYVVGLADRFGLPVEEATTTTLWTSPREERLADEIAGAGGPFVVLAPLAGRVEKEWPMERFGRLARELVADGGLLPGARVAVMGAPGERERARPLVESLPQDRRMELVGTADLLTVYALLKRASLFVGNDSGLMHMSAASGCPTIGLFGLGQARCFEPWGRRTVAVRSRESFEELKSRGAIEARPQGYRPWGRIPSTGQSYLQSLAVDEVLLAAERLIGDQPVAA